MLTELSHSLHYTFSFLEEQVADLADEEFFAQPQGAPNHPAWTLGHMIFSCQEIASELGGQRWLPAEWEGRFGYGSVPQQCADVHWSKAALLAGLKDAGTRLTDALDQLDEKAVSNPLPDEGSRETFPTMGHLLAQVVVAHTAYHAGQLTAWRRAVGKAAVGVYI